MAAVWQSPESNSLEHDSRLYSRSAPLLCIRLPILVRLSCESSVDSGHCSPMNLGRSSSSSHDVRTDPLVEAPVLASLSRTCITPTARRSRKLVNQVAHCVGICVARTHAGYPQHPKHTGFRACSVPARSHPLYLAQFLLIAFSFFLQALSTPYRIPRDSRLPGAYMHART